MKGTELLRLVWLNINQNRFKTVMTSIGIVVGAATIVMVIAIGRGGQMDVAEQFSSLNAGAIDVSYEWEGKDSGSGGFFSGGLANFFQGGLFGGRRSRESSNSDSGGGMPDMGGTAGGSMPDMGGTAGGSMPDMGGTAGGGMPDMGGTAGGGMPDMGGTAGGGMPDMVGMPGGSSEFGDIPQLPDNSQEDMGDSMVFPEDADDNRANDRGDRAEDSRDNTGDEAAGDGETEESILADRMNQENIILSADDVEDIGLFVTGIVGATISYSARASVEGGNLTEAQTYTVAGAKENYASLSNLEMAAGEFLTAEEDQDKARVCVLGASAAKELFGSAEEAYDSILYIDDRAYTVNGVLKTSGTVSAGISPDDAIFVPYETGIKYITGENISPKITVIAEDVSVLSSVISQVKSILAVNYSNAEFTFSDAGSKMEAAESSNRILTMLLSAMAAIVFIVGGIGIMNVLAVSVKERTAEIGILKSLGASRSTILLEFLLESAAISLLGGVLGVGVSFLVTPIVEMYGIRVEANVYAWAAALGFAVLTGTLFGFYPAWQASRLVPVDALNAE